MAIGGAIAGLLGAGMQASAANRAASAQERAAQNQLDLQREMFGLVRNDLGGYRQGGENALAAYLSELGLGQAPEGYQGITLSNAGQFAMDQGFDNVQSSAAARGGLRSGSALQALERTRYGIAAQDRDNQLNRLAGLVDMGMGAASMNASNANSFAQMGSNAYANMGNAAAAGAVGAGNAWAGGLNNLSGIFGYMKQPTQ